MNDLLLLQAHYNQLSDKAMFDVFFEMEKQGKRELLYKDCGLFYKSIIGTDVHALCGSIGLFLAQLAGCASKQPENLQSLLAQLTPDFSLPESTTSDLSALYSLHEQVNAAIIEIIEHMSEPSKLETLSLGENLSFTKPRFQLMLALLSHATHHRGQIAGALDILQIPNDFASSMLGL